MQPEPLRSDRARRGAARSPALDARSRSAAAGIVWLAAADERPAQAATAESHRLRRIESRGPTLVRRGRDGCRARGARAGLDRRRRRDPAVRRRTGSRPAPDGQPRGRCAAGDRRAVARTRSSRRRRRHGGERFAACAGRGAVLRSAADSCADGAAATPGCLRVATRRSRRRRRIATRWPASPRTTDDRAGLRLGLPRLQGRGGGRLRAPASSGHRGQWTRLDPANAEPWLAVGRGGAPAQGRRRRSTTRCSTSPPPSARPRAGRARGAPIAEYTSARTSDTLSAPPGDRAGHRHRGVRLCADWLGVIEYCSDKGSPRRTGARPANAIADRPGRSLDQRRRARPRHRARQAPRLERRAARRRSTEQRDAESTARRCGAARSGQRARSAGLRRAALDRRAGAGPCRVRRGRDAAARRGVDAATVDRPAGGARPGADASGTTAGRRRRGSYRRARRRPGERSFRGECACDESRSAERPLRLRRRSTSSASPA